MSQKSTEHMEPMLVPDSGKYNIFPIEHLDIWNAYKKHKEALWVAEAVDLSGDIKDWRNLSDDEQYFIKHVLAFFAAADGVVMENLAARFSNEVQWAEIRQFYAVQMYIESEHNLMYSLLIETYIDDPNEKNKLFNAIETMPPIKMKGEWAKKWITSDASFATRLIAFAVVEGIFFSGAFCSIYWIMKKKIMPGLTESNSYIARDENLHCVAPETLILTREGYKKIINCENIETEIWNGFEWCTVLPVKTGENRNLITIELDNGMSLDCTYNHNWLVVSEDTRDKQPEYYKFIKKPSDQLQLGDILQKYDLPVIDIKDPDEFKYPYINGLFSALGYYDLKYKNNGEINENRVPCIKVVKQENKDSLQTLLQHLNNEGVVVNEDIVVNEEYMLLRLNNNDIHNKFFVPINYSINTKLEWLSGFLDGDGCINKSVNNAGIEVSSIEKEFLKNVQLLLTTLDVHSDIKCVRKEEDSFIYGGINSYKRIYTLYINCYNLSKLKKLGFNSNILNLDFLNTENIINSSKFIKVSNIIKHNRVSDTFCFTELNNGTGLFNGIMTGQCMFAVLLYKNYIINKLSEEEAHSIVKEAVEIEDYFINKALPCALIGMNANLMQEYIEFCADRLVSQLGYNKIYNKENPFPWMDEICLSGHVNFFDNRSSDYKKNISRENNKERKISITNNF